MFDLSGLTTEPALSEEFSPSFKTALFDRRVHMPVVSKNTNELKTGAPGRFVRPPADAGVEFVCVFGHDALGSLLSDGFSFLGHTQCSSVFALSGLFEQGKR